MKLSNTDQRLIERCRNGDDQAWLTLYQTYSGDVGLFLKGMIGYTPDIDDLIQTVFLEFLRSLSTFRGDASIRTWLYRIARYTALNDIRTRKRRVYYERSFAESFEEEERSLEDKHLAKDQLQHLQTQLLNLDVTFREVWILRELKGYTVSETASILELNEATVRTRHHRARSKLLSSLHVSEKQRGHKVQFQSHPLVMNGGAHETNA